MPSFERAAEGAKEGTGLWHPRRAHLHTPRSPLALGKRLKSTGVVDSLLDGKSATSILSSFTTYVTYSALEAVLSGPQFPDF